jgi:hypothetical protein
LYLGHFINRSIVFYKRGAAHVPHTRVFHRPALAERIAQQVLTVALGSATSSGVFLAVPTMALDTVHEFRPPKNNWREFTFLFSLDSQLIA